MTLAQLGRRGRWAVAVGLAALMVAGLALAVVRLPLAPNVNPNYSTPNTTIGGVAELVESADFASASTAWAVVPASPFWRLVRTTNGGQSWLDVTPAGDGTNGGLELSVLGQSSAIVALRAYQYDRNSAFAVTSDGGTSWTAALLPNAVGPGPDPMALSDGGRIWAVMGSGDLVSSTDEGATWVRADLPSVAGCVPTSVRFTSAMAGWVSGGCAGVARIWATVDGGVMWSADTLSTAFPAAETVRVSLPVPGAGSSFSVGAAAGSTTGGTFQVFDRGASGWAAVAPLALPGGRILSSFASASVGWVLDLPSASAALPLAYQTSNAGANWSLRTLPMPAREVAAISLLGAGTAAVLDQAGRVTQLWTTSAGSSSWSDRRLRATEGRLPKVNGVSG